MRLAALASLTVAQVKLVRCSHKDVLLVERFTASISDYGVAKSSCSRPPLKV